MDYLIMTKDGCIHCNRAKQMLDNHGISYAVEHYETEEDFERFKLQGHRTFPRVFHDGTLVGGADDLAEYLDF